MLRVQACQPKEPSSLVAGRYVIGSVCSKKTRLTQKLRARVSLEEIQVASYNLDCICLSLQTDPYRLYMRGCIKSTATATTSTVDTASCIH